MKTESERRPDIRGMHLVAGPCCAETREVTLRAADMLQSNGIDPFLFRAGVWKPRTHADAYTGPGRQGLAWLREVRARYGFRPVTEVANADHLKAVLDEGVDAVWLGARTTVNPFSVQEIADAIAQLPEDFRQRLTVLVKNPVNPDLELWIGAMERLRRAGVTDMMALHRGFSLYKAEGYRNPPLWEIPIELNRRLPDVPILHDPSHCGGKAGMIEELMRRALQYPISGFMVETHPAPQEALSDSGQQITPGQLAAVLAKLREENSAADGGEKSHRLATLASLRTEIDRVDDELLDVLSRRMELSREIGKVKRAEGMRIVQEQRYAELLECKLSEGEKLGLPAEFLRRLFALIHSYSVAVQLADRSKSK